MDDDPTEQLARLIHDAATLLDRYDREHWATWLRDDLARIRAGDAHGVSHLLRAYGGMGSINDIMIHPANGDDVSIREGQLITDQLHGWLSEIWTIASALR